VTGDPTHIGWKSDGVREMRGRSEQFFIEVRGKSDIVSCERAWLRGKILR
jgi:hypothetical protein